MTPKNHYATEQKFSGFFGIFPLWVKSSHLPTVYKDFPLYAEEASSHQPAPFLGSVPATQVFSWIHVSFRVDLVSDRS